MIKVLRNLPAFILIMCLVLIIVGIKTEKVVIVPKDETVEKYLQKKGNEMYDIYSLKYINIFKRTIAFPQRSISARKEIFEGSTSEKLNSIIQYMNKFEYSSEQSNPNELSKKGGNCQAISLMFRELCEYNGIECRIEGDISHAYNIVDIKGQTIKIDIVNKIFEIQN